MPTIQKTVDITPHKLFPWDRPERCTVSVIIPAYNAAKTILRAIESVRIQDLTSIEIIVIDDGSVDNTPAIVSDSVRPDENLRLIRLNKNSGVSAARNAGIRVAKGMYLSFLDADDIWLPGKLKMQIEAMEQDPTITLVSCSSRHVSEEGAQLKVGSRTRPPVEGNDAWKTLLAYNFIPTPTVLTYRSLVEEIGGFDESLAVAEDLDLWIKLAVRGKVKILNTVLINYYNTRDSLMKRHSGRERNIVVPMIEKHLTQHRKHLSSREIRHIRGYHSFHTGCDMYFSGSYLPSIPVFVRASFYGARPIKSLTYIPRAMVMQLFTMLMPKKEKKNA